MSDTTPKVETVDAPKNEGTPVVPAPAPQAPVTDNTAVDELRKQLQQQEMRANQLANELKAKQEAEEAAQAKTLEEQNQYKELFEQERAKREAIEAEREENERKTAVAQAKDGVLAEYSQEVKDLAAEVGLDLTSADDSAVAAFKEKLDKINTRVANTATVSGNNGRVTPQSTELTTDELRAGLSDEQKFHEIVTARFPGIAQMTKRKS